MQTLNEELLKDLFYRHYAELCQFALGYLGSKEESEDVVQQVFASFWEGKSGQPLMENTRAYLYTAVSSRCLNLLKREGMKNRRHQLGAADLVSPTAEEATDSKLRSQDMKKIVAKALMDLPATTRQTFVLSRYHGLSQKEIAEVLECTVKNVEYHMGKALQLLRLRLADFMAIVLLSLGGGL